MDVVLWGGCFSACDDVLWMGPLISGDIILHTCVPSSHQAAEWSLLCARSFSFFCHQLATGHSAAPWFLHFPTVFLSACLSFKTLETCHSVAARPAPRR